MGYVNLGLVMIDKMVSGFLQEVILSNIMFLDMYLEILNRFLDSFLQDHAPAPNYIR